MYIIRNTFKAKPGMASKLAAMFKDVMDKRGMKVRIMTDIVGPYNTVVMEQETPSLAEFEKLMNEYADGGKDGKEMRDRMKGYTDMYAEGTREIYRVM
jgi:hypothetical protein